MNVSVITKEAWVGSSQMQFCYAQAFYDRRDPRLERPDFTLIVEDLNGICGFVTCIEIDSETLYWQFGGALHEIKKSLKVKAAYVALIKKSKDLGFKRIQTKIENTNVSMLKLALKFGFIVVGVFISRNKVYLELNKELGE